MVGNLCSFVASHLGELLTCGVSLCAIVVSWRCVKRTMHVEIKKAIVLRKLDYAERALVDLSTVIENAKALLVVIHGNLSDEHLEFVRQTLNTGIEKYAMGQMNMRPNLMLANVYFNFIKIIQVDDAFEKLKQIFVKSRQWGGVDVMDSDAREELRKCIKEVEDIIEKELAHYQTMYSTLFKKFSDCVGAKVL